MARRTRWEAGEYDAPVTPERFVLRQKVLGRKRGGAGRGSSRVYVDVVGNVVNTRRGEGLTGSEKETCVGGADCEREMLGWFRCPLNERLGGESRSSSKVRTSTGEEGAVEGSAVSRVTITGDANSGWLRRARFRLKPSAD